MDELRERIISLSKELEQLKRFLFTQRVFKLLDFSHIYDIDEKELVVPTISDIHISSDDTSWKITYTHTTNFYNENNYGLNDSDISEDEEMQKNASAQKEAYSKEAYSKEACSSDDVKNEPTHTNFRNTKVKFGMETNTETSKESNYLDTDTPHGSLFSIYTKGKKGLRIIHTRYSTELSMDEQKELITQYSRNLDIPEWFALRIYLYMINNGWANNEMCIHLSIV